MLKKSYTKGGAKCRVWFYLPAEVEAETACLVGEFNNWDRNANPMKKKKDGTFYTVLTLDVGQAYQYRYCLDGERWENDWEADFYTPNDHGTENSVVKV
ncbi:MAG: isoamylase early set domain-containing protein [Anaerolineaceae bacterium]|nr:isoamylase early set domain-containing protein [Anaerolineaceae bacterium]